MKLFHEKFGFVDEEMDRISFSQFLELIVTEPIRFRNHHWEPMVAHCHPCEVMYDHIVRLETIQEDIPTILQRHRTYRETLPSLQVRNMARDMRTKMLNLYKEYNEIPQDLIDRIYEHYRLDFELFGYTWEKSAAPCNYNTGNSSCC